MSLQQCRLFARFHSVSFSGFLWYRLALRVRSYTASVKQRTICSYAAFSFYNFYICIIIVLSILPCGALRALIGAMFRWSAERACRDGYHGRMHGQLDARAADWQRGGAEWSESVDDDRVVSGR